MAGGSANKKADKSVVESKKADGVEQEDEEGAAKCGAGDGDDVRETSC